MAVFTGGSGNVLEMMKTILTFLTDDTVFGAGNAWRLMRPATIDQIVIDKREKDSANILIPCPDSEIILKGVGSGEEEIYVGMKLVAIPNTSNIEIRLNGYAGYDPYLEWNEQPGALSDPCVTVPIKLPIVPLVADTYMTYWVTANTSRFMFVVQLSTQYEACYLGLMNPISIQRQYPYPLVIGGSSTEGGVWTDTSAGHSVFINPASISGDAISTSLRIRRPDGTWRSGLNKDAGFNSLHFSNLMVWPTNTDPVRTLTVLDDSLTMENVIMFPMLLCENNPNGLIGQLSGIYWIGNREDLSSKDNIVYNGKIYKVFSNVFRRENDQYFTIEWA